MDKESAYISGYEKGVLLHWERLREGIVSMTMLCRNDNKTISWFEIETELTLSYIFNKCKFMKSIKSTTIVWVFQCVF